MLIPHLSSLLRLGPWIGARIGTRIGARTGTRIGTRGFADSLGCSPSVDSPPSRPHLLRHSYVHGASSTPLVSARIGDALSSSASSAPGAVALVSYGEGRSLTYSELLTRADRLAAGLLSLGLQRGDRVGVWGPNSISWVLSFLAAARAGLILVTINPAYKIEELEFALNKVGCRALISAVEFKGRCYGDVLTALCPELATSDPGNLHAQRLPELRCVITMGEEGAGPPGSLSLSAVEAGGGAEGEELRAKIHDSLQPDDPANIQYTSGTTGQPKAATLSHHGIVNNALLLGLRLGYGWRDLRIALPVPLYHCFGCVGGIMVSVVFGGCLVLPSVGYDSRATLQAIAAHRCTVIYGTPTMFVDLLHQPDFSTFNLTSLTMGIMAGSPCPPDLMNSVIGKMNIPDFTIAYGTTENSPVTFIGYPRDQLYHKTHTVGCVAPHIEAKVVDPVTRELLPVDTTGELWVRGHCVMLGYWGDEVMTREVMTSDGWYRTGDIASLDSLGYCRIVGRLKDLVIRGGENVYPAEIENVLHTHPGVSDAQVVGVIDSRMGEELCACVRLKPGATPSADNIRDFCREKVANYKVPKYVVVVDGYPLTVTGKIQKFKLKADMELKLGLTK